MRTSLAFKFLSGACLVMYCYTAMAQSAVDTAGNSHVIKEVVVTGQYAAGSQDKAVQRIRVTDRKKIDAMNAQTLKDVLTNDMNIRLSQDNILGSGMSMQGISGQNVKILIDGVPVIGRQDGNIDLSQIMLNNIERIEIVEGPMSVNYGTDALAGTINLITKKTQRNLFETHLVTYYESIGTYNANLRTGFHKGRHTASLSGGRNFFDGWNNGEKVAVNFDAEPADSRRVQQWKPKEQYLGEGQYTYKTGNTTLSYKGGVFNEKITNLGMPRLPYGENAFDDYYSTYRVDNAFFVTSTLPRQRNIHFQVAYNDYKRIKNTFYNDLTTLEKELSTNDGDQDTSRFHALSSRATFGTSRTDVKINYEVGYDLRIEDANGVRIKEGKQQIGDYAAFASAEYAPLDKLTIRPGVRYGYNTAYTAPLIPSLNVRYKVSDALTLRGSYARGFRSPSLKDLYFYFVDVNHNIKGNENLKAEYSDNYSVSAVYATAIRAYKVKAEGAAYYNHIRDLITLGLTQGTEFSYSNVGKYITKGVQANTEVTKGSLKASVGASYLGNYNLLSETQNAARFSYSSEVRASVFYELKGKGLTIAAFFKRTGKLPGFVMDGGQLKQSFIDPYNTADISVAKLLFDRRVNIAIGCKNLFDIKNIAQYAAAAGGAHSAAGSMMAISNGRLYFIKADINLKRK